MENANEVADNETIRPHLGPFDIAFFVIAAAAPLGATLGVAPMVYGAAGYSVTYLFAFAAIALLLFSVGFAYSCKASGGSGGFAELIAMGLGRPIGDMAGGISLLAYCAMLAGIVGQIAALIPSPPVGRSWLVNGLAVLALVAFLGYRRIDLSRRFMAIVISLELCALLVLDVALLTGAHNSEAAIPAPVMPDFGTSGSAIGLMFAFACFVGFESTALYGEEARDPINTLPKATYLAIGTIGAFYGFTMWCLGVAYDNPMLRHLAGENPAAFVPMAAQTYLGDQAATVIELLGVLSLLAVLISFHNALARYIHQLAGGGLLPHRLHQVHARFDSPHLASLVVSVAITVIVTAFAIAGGDPVSQLYAWLVGLGTLAIVLIQALCAISISVYIFRTGGPVPTALATVLGGLGLTIAFVLCATNFDMLSGSGGVAMFLPVLIVLAGLVAMNLRKWIHGQT